MTTAFSTALNNSSTPPHPTHRGNWITQSHHNGSEAWSHLYTSDQTVKRLSKVLPGWGLPRQYLDIWDGSALGMTPELGTITKFQHPATPCTFSNNASLPSCLPYSSLHSRFGVNKADCRGIIPDFFIALLANESHFRCYLRTSMLSQVGTQVESTFCL